jgi:signal transduction histidine kinase/GAF domain-containing protein/CheY-like chemotaxis protein
MASPGERYVDTSRLFGDLVQVLEPALDVLEISARVQQFLLGALKIDMAGTYLADPDGDQVLVQGTLTDLGPDERRIPAASPLLVSLRRTLRPLRVPASEHPNPAAARRLVARGVKRVVVAPLPSGGRLLGLFVVSRFEDAAMADLNDDLFQALGRILGLSLEQARLAAAARARLEVDRVLLDTARLAATSTDLEAVLAKYCEALSRAAGSERCAIGLPDSGDPERLRIRACFGHPPGEEAAFRAAPFPLSTPSLVRAYATRRLVIAERPTLVHEVARRIATERGYGHVLVLPLVAREQVLGAAFMSGVGAVDADRQVVIEAVGHEIALAISSSAEREASRRAAEREALEAELRGSVRDSFDLPAILQGAAEKLGRTLGVARVIVGFADPENPGTIRITQEYRRSPELASALAWRFPVDLPLRDEADTGREPVVCHDVARDPRFSGGAIFAPSDARSFVIANFFGPSLGRGALAVGEVGEARRWSDEEVRLVRAAAEHCAIAAARAELYEDARRRAEELELTISQMTDGFVMLNDKFEITRMNDTARQLLWVDATPVGPVTATSNSQAIDIFELDGRKLEFTEYPGVVAFTKGVAVRDHELRFRHVATGQERIMQVNASPLRDGSGKRIGHVNTFHDVTERRAAAAHAARTEKLRVVGELAASVAHELNNTLAAVLGHAELILAQAPDPELKKRADVIAQAVRDSAQILGRLTRLSQKKHASGPRGPNDVARLAADAIELTRSRWQVEALRDGREIAVDLDLATGGEPATVLCVAGELREVFTNLILNSVDALPRGGRIRVAIGNEPGEVVLAVEDTGVGMSDAVLRQAFEPFFTTKGEAGTGLGLSISAAIVAAHGGRIDVRSTPGSGTAITVRLPRHTSAETPATTRLPTERRRLLVVDDDPRVRSLLADVLAADGHAVREASSGEEALATLEQDGEPIDVLVTDLAMPGMSGIVLGEEVRARFPRAGIVLVSGWTANVSPESLDRLRARLVSKPFRNEDVKAAIAAALSAASLSGSRPGA